MVVTSNLTLVSVDLRTTSIIVHLSYIFLLILYKLQYTAVACVYAVWVVGVGLEFRRKGRKGFLEWVGLSASGAECRTWCQGFGMLGSGNCRRYRHPCHNVTQFCIWGALKLADNHILHLYIIEKLKKSMLKPQYDKTQSKQYSHLEPWNTSPWVLKPKTSLTTWQSLTETLSLKLGTATFTVEARKLEHHYPHALRVKYKGS